MCFETHTRVYTCFSDRLLSFKNWPGVQSPLSLASAGFFYINPDDDVKCFYCGIRISNWKPSDDPLSEHLRWSKDCVFANLLIKNQINNDKAPVGNANKGIKLYVLLCALILYFDVPTYILLFVYFIILHIM